MSRKLRISPKRKRLLQGLAAMGRLNARYNKAVGADDAPSAPTRHMYNETGAIRPEVLTSAGFDIGEKLVPWPLKGTWAIVSRLPAAMDAYRLTLAGKLAMIRAFTGEGKDKDIEAMFKAASVLYKQSGLLYSPETEAEIALNIAYGLAYEGLNRQDEDWPNNLLKRPRTEEELAALDEYITVSDIIDNAEYAVKALCDYFSGVNRGGERPFLALP